MSRLCVNLLPQHRIIGVQRARIVRRWAAWLGCYTLGLAIVGFGLDKLVGPGDGVSQQLAEQRALLDAKTASINALSKSVSQQRARLNAANEVGKHPDWGVLLGYLSTRVPEHGAVRLTAIELASAPRESPSPDGKGKLIERVTTVRFAGSAGSPQLALDFARVLHESGVFDQVTTQSIGGSPTAGSAGVDVRSDFAFVCELVEEVRGAQLRAAASGGDRP